MILQTEQGINLYRAFSQSVYLHGKEGRLTDILNQALDLDASSFLVPLSLPKEMLHMYVDPYDSKARI